ncbi:DUF389 domain-containing protein [Lysobacter enzymogenes]|uniref:TIGR00341 family protein n=1 Tax=Lysobacter enzymogenes TaxID=69 RepID=A0AAU9AKH5_LYSEN|nr:DUF389 domain-containing protein [Lysobacter enzymogenes]BAV95761.1 conserved hypothetical protein [Lysobacter enzymogenes]
MGLLDKIGLEARWRWFRRWRQNHLIEGIDRAAVLEHVRDAGGLGPRYAFMIVMSCGIATLGLLQNSVAVIIGAMLISPLMGPIIELGMGLATFDLRTIRGSLAALAAGVAAALLIAVAIVIVSPLQEPTAEILARTQPTLFDLLVAVFSGLAGAYATVTRKGETIVGVAIATALMPPLAVVGYGVALVNLQIAAGAAFLFMTNLLAIALSVTVVARLYGFGSSDSPKQTVWQAGLILGIFTLLSVPLGLALHNIASRSWIERTVRQVVDAEAARSKGRVSVIRVHLDGEDIKVDTVLMLPAHVAALEERMVHALRERTGRAVTVQLHEVLLQDEASILRESTSLAELRSSVAQLEDAVQRRQASEVDRVRQDQRLRDDLVARLGRIETLADGRRRLWLDSRAGLSLNAAHHLEQSAGEDSLTLEVVPAIQDFPDIRFADDSAVLDTNAKEKVAVAAWAAQRWRVNRLRVTGAGGTVALARQRADAVASALREQGVGADVDTLDGVSLRRSVQREGTAAARMVTLRTPQE